MFQDQSFTFAWKGKHTHPLFVFIYWFFFFYQEMLSRFFWDHFQSSEAAFWIVNRQGSLLLMKLEITFTDLYPRIFYTCNNFQFLHPFVLWITRAPLLSSPLLSYLHPATKMAWRCSHFSCVCMSYQQCDANLPEPYTLHHAIFATHMLPERSAA